MLRPIFGDRTNTGEPTRSFDKNAQTKQDFQGIITQHSLKLNVIHNNAQAQREQPGETRTPSVQPELELEKRPSSPEITPENQFSHEISKEIECLQDVLCQIDLNEIPSVTQAEYTQPYATAVTEPFSIAEEQIPESSKDKDAESPTTVEDMTSCIEAVIADLRALGIPIAPASSLTLGKELGRGAFGTVRLGTLDLSGAGPPVPVAIKTLLAAGGADFRERLDAYAVLLRLRAWRFVENNRLLLTK